MARKGRTNLVFSIRPLAIETTGDINWWNNTQLSLEAVGLLLNSFAKGTGVEFRVAADNAPPPVGRPSEEPYPKKPTLPSRKVVSVETLDEEFVPSHGSLFRYSPQQRFELFIVPTLGRIEPPDNNRYGNWFCGHKAGYLSIDLWKDHSPPLLETYIAFFSIRTLVRRWYEIQTGHFYDVTCEGRPCLLSKGRPPIRVSIIQSFFARNIFCTQCRKRLKPVLGNDIRTICDKFALWLHKEMESEDQQYLLHLYRTDFRDRLARTLVECWRVPTRQFRLLTTHSLSSCQIPAVIARRVLEPDEVLILHDSPSQDVHVLTCRNPHFLKRSRLDRFVRKFSYVKDVVLYPWRPTTHMPQQVRSRFGRLCRDYPSLKVVPLRGLDDGERLSELFTGAAGTASALDRLLEDAKTGPVSPALPYLYTLKTAHEEWPTAEMHLISPGLMHKVRLVSELNVAGVLHEFVKSFDADEMPLYDLVVETVNSIFLEAFNFDAHDVIECCRRLDDLMRVAHPYRDHFLHQFQVFLMGCVLLDKLSVALKKSKDELQSIEQAWVASSLLHDITYGHERMPHWLPAILNPHRAKPLANEPSAKPDRLILDLVRRAVEEPALRRRLKAWIGESKFATRTGKVRPLGRAAANQLLQQCKTPGEKHYHCYAGALASIAFFRARSGKRDLDELAEQYPLDIIASAILFHHSYSSPVLKRRRIVFEETPVTFLLMLCDATQECGRASSQDSDSSKFIRLSEPDINLHYGYRNRLTIRMTYTMKASEGESQDVFNQRMEGKDGELQSISRSLASKTSHISLVLEGIVGSNEDPRRWIHAIRRI